MKTTAAMSAERLEQLLDEKRVTYYEGANLDRKDTLLTKIATCERYIRRVDGKSSAMHTKSTRRELTALKIRLAELMRKQRTH